MIDLVAKVLGEVASNLIETGVRQLFTPTSPPLPVVDPVSEAQGAVNGFLTALAERDWDTFCAWCEPLWTEDPNTAVMEAAWMLLCP